MTETVLSKGDKIPSLAELKPGDRIVFVYKNWEGKVAERKAEFRKLGYGATQWHPTPGDLMHALDLEKGEERIFAVPDMEEVHRLVLAESSEANSRG